MASVAGPHSLVHTVLAKTEKHWAMPRRTHFAIAIAGFRALVNLALSAEAWTGRIRGIAFRFAAYAIGGIACFRLIQRLQVVIA